MCMQDAYAYEDACFVLPCLCLNSLFSDLLEMSDNYASNSGFRANDTPHPVSLNASGSADCGYYIA